MSVSRVVKVLSKVGLSQNGTHDDLQEATQLKAVIGNSNQSILLGSGPESDAEISQWLSFAQYSFDSAAAEKLNKFLSNKSYLVGKKVTIADVSIFVTVQDAETVDLLTFPHIARWFKHIQSLTINSAVKVFPTTITVFPTSTKTSTETTAANDAIPAPPAVSKATSEVVDATSNKDAKQEKKKEKPAKEAAAVASKDVAPTAAASEKELDPSKLDIRVGLVVKCWNHPESDKLLCEEIDLGEGSTRTIASGLRAHYSAEEVQGRKVIVLANLKERPMAGFKSQGMVLCAVNGDHSVVKLLAPPAAAQIGERISFPGFVGEAAPAAQVAKKKILEGLAPLLRTDENGNAMWNTSVFTLESGVVNAPLPNAIVS